MKDLFNERARGEEAQHFRNRDDALIAKMRERARAADIAKALAEKLRVDDAQLLARVQALGLDHETGTAVLFAPLIQVAWADGAVSDAERAVILETAASRGVESDTPVHAKLEEWMKTRPSNALFETATECMRIGFAVLPGEERAERLNSIVAACRKVAEASGNTLGRLLGLGDGVSADEERVLDAIAHKLQSGAPAQP
jgi:tellurite resistance protein